jgi:dienelactone hydrolase
VKTGRRGVIAALALGVAGAAVRVCEAAVSPGHCGGPDLAGFRAYCFTDTTGEARQLYVTGEGPPVLLLHELPGLIDADLRAAQRLAAEGYTVVAPLLFGSPGGEGHALRYARRLCGREQFACNTGTTTSPHVGWLRELVGDVRNTWPDGQGVGVVGMCLTGAFPLALLREDAVVAPVLLQPTIPFNVGTRLGWFTDVEALGISPEDLAYAKHEREVPLLGLRYQKDWRCRTARFRRLSREFGDRFYRLDLPGKGHSTLGADFCDHAFEEIRAFLNRYLRSEPSPRVDPFPLRSRPGAEQDVLAPVCTTRHGTAHQHTQ